METAYISCDPGAKGSFCLLVPTLGHIEFYPTNELPINIISWLKDAESKYKIKVIMLEDVHAIFGTSANSNFKFGYNVGVVNALCASTGSMVDRVSPKKWQKELGITAKGKLIKKAVAEKILMLYPKAVIKGPKGGLLDGRSDSLAIAHFALLKY